MPTVAIIRRSRPRAAVWRCCRTCSTRSFIFAIRVRISRRSVSSWLSPGPRVPIPPPVRERWVQRRVRRGSWYSSCASSTWRRPSWVWACWAKMSRISRLRSITLTFRRPSSAFCWLGLSSSSATRTSKPVSLLAWASSSALPFPTYQFGSTWRRFCHSAPTTSAPAVVARFASSVRLSSAVQPWSSPVSTATRNAFSAGGVRSICVMRGIGEGYPRGPSPQPSRHAAARLGRRRPVSTRPAARHDPAMTDPRALPDDRPNIGSETFEDEIAELQGEAPFRDQDSVLDPDEIEAARPPTLSEQEWGVPVSDDLRSGETDDPLVAIEEGQTWVPPSDPPIVVSEDREGVDSPGGDALDAESDINARIREELRADAATTALADRVEIAGVGSTAVLRGQVGGIEDTDALLEVVSRVEGIDEVRDETEVPGL